MLRHFTADQLREIDEHFAEVRENCGGNLRRNLWREAYMLHPMQPMQPAAAADATPMDEEAALEEALLGFDLSKNHRIAPAAWHPCGGPMPGADVIHVLKGWIFREAQLPTLLAVQFHYLCIDSPPPDNFVLRQYIRSILYLGDDTSPHGDLSYENVACVAQQTNAYFVKRLAENFDWFLRKQKWVLLEINEADRREQQAATAAASAAASSSSSTAAARVFW
jgi:hypothetical protein